MVHIHRGPLRLGSPGLERMARRLDDQRNRCRDLSPALAAFQAPLVGAIASHVGRPYGAIVAERHQDRELLLD
jgi:hypothetical protein